MKKMLGILGGMGSAAGVQMANSLVRIAQSRGAEKDSDFPEFILYNIPVDGMDETGISDGDLLCPQIAQGIFKLVEFGCHYVVIACNTVHCFLPQISLQTNVPVINMIWVAGECAEGFKKVGILCSRTSRKLRLFEKELERRGVEPVTTTDDEQGFVDLAVAAVIAGDHSHSVAGVVSNMKERGAEAVLIGCTELPLCEVGNGQLRVIDVGEKTMVHALNLMEETLTTTSS